ncbi:hypothetical protein KTC92_07405 [Clostridium sp. CM027]|uniref:hypothetical protein n=1 Tax=Clostridium sp. CM027 TaxID=2849865 RepID=UPI00215A306A|nr:hypothetical protein [Clostridium sp. CM027]UVE42256.1 hypothetical protein KTC92_07405 [Clostridium sp. CM027]
MNVFKGKMTLYKIVYRILFSINPYGINSKKKGKNTATLILQSIEISEVDFRIIINK